MNKNLLIKTIFSVGLCFSMLNLHSCKTEKNPRTYILKALEAHGGIEKWENMTRISYTKTTLLYDSLGNKERELVQKHVNVFKPDFMATMSWSEQGVDKEVTLQNNEITIRFNDSIVDDEELKQKYFKSITAANYVLWQPYKLLDSEVELHYVGKEDSNGKQVQVIKASYFNEDGSPANTWWYYFDSKTNKLLGNMVHHGTTYSYIENIKYEHQTGLFLNAERKSYMTDSLRNIKFLRAHYFYEDFSSN